MYDYKWFKKIKTFSHPDGFNVPDGTLNNDIAVIELEENFEARYVAPACLAAEYDALYAGPLMVSFERPVEP